MASNLTDLTEVAHWWGSDLQLSSTGDVATVGVGQSGQITKSNQRVMRRLMTNPGQYLSEQSYGAGVPEQIGMPLDVPKVQALISGQMQLEASVQQSPAPDVTVTSLQDGVDVSAAYTVAPQAIPAVLSFTYG